MEPVFSLTDYVDKAISSKTDTVITNFCYNLVTYFNKRCSSAEKLIGFSP